MKIEMFKKTDLIYVALLLTVLLFAVNISFIGDDSISEETIKKLENKALSGDTNAFFPLFSYYIYQKNDYKKSESIYKKLSKNGFKDEAISAIASVANIDEFKKNSKKMNFLLQEVDKNESFAVFLFSLIKYGGTEDFGDSNSTRKTPE